MSKITEQQRPKLTASLVEHQDAFDLSTKSAQWVIQNTKEAIKIASKTWEEHYVKNNVFKFITEFVIIVSNDYKHSTYIKSFRKKYKSGLYYSNSNITDKNFKNPSRILKPGDIFICKIFSQIKSDKITSEEKLAFLKLQNAVFLGAQGICLVYEQGRDKLLKGKSYSSFDEKERLWEDHNGYHRVPNIGVDLDGGFGFYISIFGNDCKPSTTLLCFCEKK